MEWDYVPYGKSNLSKIRSKNLPLKHSHTHRSSSESPVFAHWQLAFSKAQWHPGRQIFCCLSMSLPVLFTIWELYVKIQSHCKPSQRDFLGCFHWRQKAVIPMPMEEPSTRLSSLFSAVCYYVVDTISFCYSTSGGRLRKLYLLSAASPKNKTHIIGGKKISYVKLSYTHANWSLCRVKYLVDKINTKKGVDRFLMYYYIALIICMQNKLGWVMLSFSSVLSPRFAIRVGK